MNCAIVANGMFSDDQIPAARLLCYDLLICCDGGARHLTRMGVRPDVVLGDFDSISPETLDFYKSVKPATTRAAKPGPEIIPFPAEKDYTDSQLAVEYALSRGAAQIDLYGFTGTRLDHSLSNIFLLPYIQRHGARGRILDAHNTLFLAESPLTEIDGKPGQLLSLIALSREVSGVTLNGLKYPLTDAVLTQAPSIGISNVFTEDKARVIKKSGELLIVLSRDQYDETFL